MASGDNPIYSVGEVTNIPCPSSYTYLLEDISRADAGRTEDGVMHKNRIGQTVGLELSWNNITDAQCQTILRAFNPEYVTVVYKDPLVGSANSTNPYSNTLKMYVGNRSAPMYNSKLGLWQNVSFKLIDVNGATKTW